VAKFPALPLWTDAYLGDTITLTTIEHGCYLLLLMTAWRTATCDLPDDDKFLARSCRMTIKQWLRVKQSLLKPPYWHLKSGRWFNKRLLDERDAVRQLIAQRSNAGKSSAMKRLNRDSTSVERADNERSTPTPTPTPTPIPLKENNPPMSPLEEPARAASPQDYFFRGKVFRVSVHDAQRWKEVYNLVPDLRAELEAADAYYADNPPKNGKWFFAVSNWLKRVHVAAQQKQEDERRAKRTWN